MCGPIKRRDFHALSLAALGGLTTGTLGERLAAAAPPAGDEDKAGEKPGADTAKDKKDKPKKDKQDKPKTKEIHICRGLNSCVGMGRTGDNKCAGQGDCATTLRAPHECSTMNRCKGQGGCNGKAGKNACDGKGDGPVPLTEESWPSARKTFEAKMKALKKKVGEAPPSEAESDWKKKYEETLPKKPAAGKDAKADGKTPEKKDEDVEKTAETHVCRGLNSCQNKGSSGANKCAGQGTCATTMLHDCAMKNECKEQGGCKLTAGKNGCKRKGEGPVPLNDEAWKAARAAFEAKMTRLKKIGKAPEKDKKRKDLGKDADKPAEKSDSENALDELTRGGKKPAGEARKPAVKK